MTIVDDDARAEAWKAEALRQASASPCGAVAVQLAPPANPNAPKVTYKCGAPSCNMWVNDAIEGLYGHSDRCPSRNGDGVTPAQAARAALLARFEPSSNGDDPPAGAGMLPGATDLAGWPVALDDDRRAVTEGDTIDPPREPDLFGLFYSGLSNLIAGSPDTGKSWAVLAAAAEAAVAGRLLWLDAEDTAETFSRRCLILGCPELTTSAEVRRINHGDWIMAEPEDIEACFRWLADGFGPGLIVIDSGTASGSGDNLDQWTSWTRRHLPGPGAGVGSILVEHVVKNPDDRHGQGAGSRAKLAAIRGMALLIDELEGTPWAPATDTTPPRPAPEGSRSTARRTSRAAPAGRKATVSACSTANPAMTAA